MYKSDHELEQGWVRTPQTHLLDTRLMGVRVTWINKTLGGLRGIKIHRKTEITRISLTIRFGLFPFLYSPSLNAAKRATLAEFHQHARPYTFLHVARLPVLFVSVACDFSSP